MADAGEFYVGWADHAPPGLARRLRLTVLGLVLALPLLFGSLAALQSRLPSGIYEFLDKRSFSGVLYTEPVPLLRLESAEGGFASVLLVGTGKSGLPPAMWKAHGRTVRFDGRLIYRRGKTMIEVDADPDFRVSGEAGREQRRGPPEVIGEVDLTGELVDTKCWLGVMRPASGKVHRACAVRCLSGGVPPGLLVRDTAADSTVFLLAGEQGEALEIDPQLAGRELRVSGRLELYDTLPVLRVHELALAGNPGGPQSVD